MLPELDGRLNSWKEIASFLDREVRTVQRWEKQEGLPVHRHLHAKVSSVYAFKIELLDWQRSRTAVPLASAGDIELPPASERTSPAISRWRIGAYVALFVAALSVLLILVANRPAKEPLYDDLNPVPLASELGEQYSPTFSPDGHQVAFVWNGYSQDNFDIYVKQVGSQGARRLTNSTSTEYSPVWSPNGDWIAFCRGGSGAKGGALFLISPRGGAERKLIDLETFAAPANHVLSWSADQKWLAISEQLQSPHPLPRGIYLIEVATGYTKQVTFPGPQEEDVYPTFSFHNRQLAFTRDVGRGVSINFSVELDASMSPLRNSVRQMETVGFENLACSVPAWTQDDKKLVFTSNRGGFNRLWSVPVHAPEKARLLAALGNDVVSVASSARGQLAFAHRTVDYNIWKIDVTALLAGRSVRPTPAIASTRLEESPQVSPNGRKLVFMSNLTGFLELWTSNLDGTDAMPITAIKHPGTGSPAWSPDGRQIVFDARVKGKPDIYVIAADGSKPPLRLTSDLAANVIPSWSPDGKSIFFSSSRSGTRQIWRMAADGSNPAQLTKQGGFAALSSPDGKRIYYTKDREENTPLWELDFQTRKESLVLPSLRNRAFAVCHEGIYYFETRPSKVMTLNYYDLRSQKSRCLFTLDRPMHLNPALSPGGRYLFYSQIDQSGSDLMMVEKFN